MVEFCGAAYHGWQWQKNQCSVQQVVEHAISKVADHELRVTTAGRTDAGVHASGLVIHFDSPSERSLSAWIKGINRYLPDDVSVPWVTPVPKEFHARYSALSRRYRYVVFNRDVPLGYLQGRIAWHKPPLTLAPMQEGAQMLIGQHDFSAFRAASCQAHDPVKQVYELTIAQHGHWFYLDIAANGFLHHMVRNIMGVLLRIGEGLAPASWAQEVLHSGDRRFAAKTAPAAGLYFVAAQYPEKFALPEAMPACQFW